MSKKEEKISITGFELLVSLLLVISTISFLVAPGSTYSILKTACWYVPLMALAPGLLYCYILSSLVANSPYPLPRLLEYYWGKLLGLVLGLAYALFFLSWCVLWCRLFVDFQLSVITPMQPISVLLGGILLVAVYGLKKGVTATIRALEMLFFVLLLFHLIIIVLSLIRLNPHLLLPIYHVKPLALAKETLFYSRFYAISGIILILGTFLSDGSDPGHITRQAIVITGVWMSLTLMSTLGIVAARIGSDTYPVFDMVRYLNLGEFIRNLDALFIVAWFVGIFAGIYVSYFAYTFTLKEVFRLSDHKPLASASAVMIGVLSLGLGSSNLQVTYLDAHAYYPLLMIFGVLIPLVTWLIGLTRGQIKLGNSKNTIKNKGGS